MFSKETISAAADANPFSSACDLQRHPVAVAAFRIAPYSHFCASASSFLRPSTVIISWRKNACSMCT